MPIILLIRERGAAEIPPRKTIRLSNTVAMAPHCDMTGYYITSDRNALISIPYPNLPPDFLALHCTNVAHGRPDSLLNNKHRLLFVVGRLLYGIVFRSIIANLFIRPAYLHGLVYLTVSARREHKWQSNNLDHQKGRVMVASAADSLQYFLLN